MKIKQIIADLNSGDRNKIKKALAYIKVEGNNTTLQPMLNILKTELSSEFEEPIKDIFFNLKDSSSVEVIIDLLRDDENSGQRSFLLTAIWNSSLDFSNYLPDFVGIAVDGDLMDAVDCLTIIENMEGPFEEHHVLESQLFLKEYLEDTAPKDPQKAQMISEIALIIKDIDQSIDG